MTDDNQLEIILRKTDLPKYVGLRRSAIERLMLKGQFPRGFFLNKACNQKGWTVSEIREWQVRFIAEGRRLTAKAEYEANLAEEAKWDREAEESERRGERIDGSEDDDDD